MLNNYSSLKNVFLSLLFIFSISFIFRDECDDDSAINFNPNSDGTIDCVFVSNIPTFKEQMRIQLQVKNLNFSISGDNSDLYENVSFTVECININGIVDNGCYINENNDLFVELVEDF